MTEGTAPALQTTGVKRVNIIFTNSPAQNSIIVDPDHFKISKHLREQVEWNCTTSGFSIDFEGDCPFDTPHFERPDPGSIPSGVANKTGPSFKYKVTIGGNVLDPDGQVDP
jgi:hypothetical protein